MALKLDSLNFHLSLFGIALYQGDAEGARKQEEWAKGKPEEGLILNVQATQAGFSGQYRKYRELTMRAVEIAQGFNLPQRAADFMTGLAGGEAAIGYQAEARREAAAALRLAPASDLTTGAAPGARRVCAGGRYPAGAGHYRRSGQALPDGHSASRDQLFRDSRVRRLE
jgi:hypothetical protein